MIKLERKLEKSIRLGMDRNSIILMEFSETKKYFDYYDVSSKYFKNRNY